MGTWSLIALSFTSGCKSADESPIDRSGSTAETGGAATGDTAVPSGPPTSLLASCDATANALRFACHVNVDPPQAVQVSFAAGSAPARVHASASHAREHDVPLYFLRPDTTYQWTASAVDWPTGLTASGSFTTGPVPVEVASHLQVGGASSVPYVGTNFPCGGSAAAVVYDTVTGDLVWYHDLDPSGAFTLLNMVQFTEDHTVLGQTGGEVVEVDLAGDDLVRWREGVDYDVNLHHDLFERDGRYYLLYQVPGLLTLDGFLVKDATGQELGRWFSADHLPIPSDAVGDWMHTNTIWVDDQRRVYLSSLTQNTIYRVDGDPQSAGFGRPDWFLGEPPAGLGNDFTLDWSAVDGPDEFADQHSVHVRPDGRLAFLDNANGRALVASLDEGAHTARVDQAWSTGVGACGPQGTSAESAAGNTFVACSTGDLLEWSPVTRAQVWSAHPVCGSGFVPPAHSATRWYPLEGW